jgi:hypothetical protein
MCANGRSRSKRPPMLGHLGYWFTRLAQPLEGSGSLGEPSPKSSGMSSNVLLPSAPWLLAWQLSFNKVLLIQWHPTWTRLADLVPTVFESQQPVSTHSFSLQLLVILSTRRNLAAPFSVWRISRNIDALLYFRLNRISGSPRAAHLPLS